MDQMILQLLISMIGTGAVNLGVTITTKTVNAQGFS
jgi:hypothetical protein